MGATPFKRVTDDVDVDPRFQDNSFEAKVSPFVWNVRKYQILALLLKEQKLDYFLWMVFDLLFVSFMFYF